MKAFWMFFKKLNFNSQLSRNQKIVRLLQKSKYLNEEEVSMIQGILTIKEFTAREVMTPRVDVTVLSFSSSRQVLIDHLKKSFHSRFPVYDKNIDDIKGVVHIREIIQTLFSKENGDKNYKKPLVKISKDPFFIPESRFLLDVLRDLQKAHIQMAIVVDEYGGFSGIITMEDIMEEIIGDVQDESDEEMEEIILEETSIYSVDARLDLEVINEKLGMEFVDERADTIGGYVVNLFGRIPKKKQSIVVDQIKFTIKTKKGNSVTRIKIDLTKNNKINKK